MARAAPRPVRSALDSPEPLGDDVATTGGLHDGSDQIHSGGKARLTACESGPRTFPMKRVGSETETTLILGMREEPVTGVKDDGRTHELTRKNKSTWQRW